MEEENDVQDIVTPEPVEKTDHTVPYDRFAQEVAKRKALEERLAAIQPKEEPELTAREAPMQFDTLVDNLSALRTLDDEEVTELKGRSTELGVDPVRFAKSELWKKHLESLRANKSAESKTPAPSHRTAVFEGKTFAEVVSGDDSKAKQAAFIAQRDALLNRGRNQMI